MDIDIKRLMEASYVSVKRPEDGKQLAFDGRLLDIVLDVGDYVWIHASYADQLLPGCVQVGDYRSNGYTHDGNCIVSVPAAWCTFYTDEEAAQIEAAIYADDRMGRYAQG